MPKATIDSKSFTKAIKAVSRFVNASRERTAYIHLVFTSGSMYTYACDGYRASESCAPCIECDGNLTGDFTAYINVPRILPLAKKECLVEIVLDDGVCTVSFDGISMRTKQPDLKDQLDLKEIIDDACEKASQRFGLNINYTLDALRSLKESGAAVDRNPVIVEFTNELDPVVFRGKHGGRSIVLPVRLKEEDKHATT